MTNYLTLIQRKFGNNLVQLAEFQTGPASRIYATTHSKPVTIDGITYEPQPFRTGAISASTAFRDDSIKITVAATHPICEHYRQMMTDYDVRVIVREGYLNRDGTPVGVMPTDFPVIVNGNVGSYEFEATSGEATLGIVTLADTLASPSQTRNYQPGCPLRLYGPKCRAVKVLEDITEKVSNVVGSQLQVLAGWNLTSFDNYVGGIIEFHVPVIGIQYRMISDCNSSRITFVGSGEGLNNATTVNISKGCPRTLQACVSLHNNGRNYGGQPFQPSVNPYNRSMR